MNNDQPAIEERIRTSLDISAQYLDADTKKRLLEIRRVALCQPSKKPWFELNSWVPAVSLVFCSVFAVILVLPSHNKQTPNDGSTTVEQTAMLELIENPDELDALSDPGFYAWADEVNIDELNIDKLENKDSKHHAV